MPLPTTANFYNRFRATMVYIHDGRIRRDDQQQVYEPAGFIFIELQLGYDFVMPLPFKEIGFDGMPADYDITEIQIIDKKAPIPIQPEGFPYPGLQFFPRPQG